MKNYLRTLGTSTQIDGARKRLDSLTPFHFCHLDLAQDLAMVFTYGINNDIAGLCVFPQGRRLAELELYILLSKMLPRYCLSTTLKPEDLELEQWTFLSYTYCS